MNLFSKLFAILFILVFSGLVSAGCIDAGCVEVTEFEVTDAVGNPKTTFEIGVDPTIRVNFKIENRGTEDLSALNVRAYMRHTSYNTFPTAYDFKRVVVSQLDVDQEAVFDTTEWMDNFVATTPPGEYKVFFRVANSSWTYYDTEIQIITVTRSDDDWEAVTQVGSGIWDGLTNIGDTFDVTVELENPNTDQAFNGEYLFRANNGVTCTSSGKVPITIAPSEIELITLSDCTATDTLVKMRVNVWDRKLEMDLC